MFWKSRASVWDDYEDCLTDWISTDQETSRDNQETSRSNQDTSRPNQETSRTNQETSRASYNQDTSKDNQETSKANQTSKDSYNQQPSRDSCNTVVMNPNLRLLKSSYASTVTSPGLEKTLIHYPNSNHRTILINGNPGKNNSDYVATVTNTAYGKASGMEHNVQYLTVSIVRGRDGFGFTICSDSPVRVQAVDPGGPAHQAGLQQSDTVIQLNRFPVEQWKCVDLAHAIRTCHEEMVLVVCRSLSLVRPYLEGLSHRASPLSKPPSHTQSGRHKQGQGSGVKGLSLLWRDKREEPKYSSCMHTLKGTRVTSSDGDNYIILSPVEGNSGSQLLQCVYQDSNKTLGRMYQTHPRRGQHQPQEQTGSDLQDPRGSCSRRSINSETMPHPSSSASSLSSPQDSYGNYQNCTIVQSHLPHSSCGKYVSLPPKTLIFPMFVQPLDLCGPDRSLLLAEEMILHQKHLSPAKVTVLIYTDLILLTREEEAGRCNVLQGPLYLHSIRLRDVPSDPTRLHLLHWSEGSESLLGLEAFSLEQKRRVSQCLREQTSTLHEQQGFLDNLHGDLRLERPDLHGDRSLESLDAHGDRSLERPDIHRDRSLERPDFHGDRSLERPDIHRDRSLERPDIHGDRSLERPDIHGDRSLERPDIHGDRSLERPDFHGDRSLERPDIHRDRSLERPDIHGDRSLERPDIHRGRSQERPDPHRGRSLERPDIHGDRSLERPDLLISAPPTSLPPAGRPQSPPKTPPLCPISMAHQSPHTSLWRERGGEGEQQEEGEGEEQGE